jgi:signal transduction histidine kinase
MGILQHPALEVIGVSRTLRTVVDSIPLPPDLTQVTLLIADSDPQELRVLQQRLQAGGYDVLTAKTGEQAIKLVHREHPHLLLLDAELCESAVCQRIKNDDSLGFMPIIILFDAQTHPPDYDLFAEADAAIPKPVDGSALAVWLRPLLRTKMQIDRLMRENRKLTEASQAVESLKTNIITNVSHELRTPLVQVKAAVSLLVEDVVQNTTREQPSVADMALQAVARLESAVENIRQLAQTQQIRLSPVVIGDAVNLAIRNLKRSWGKRGEEERIELRIDNDLPPVLGDKRAIAHLLQLLLDNALKFSPETSPVHVIAYAYDDEQVCIGVQDFGIGIPREEHARVFEAFYQVDGSPTRRYGGTGTGLALATLLAKGLNTTIKLESDLGEGSTFWFLLPAIDLDEYEGD